MKITIPAVLLSLLFLFIALPGQAQTCEASLASSQYRWSIQSDDMTDLSYILRSAQSADLSCVQIARDKLYSKLEDMSFVATLWPQDDPWKQHWSGVSLSFALSSGLILGSRGYLTDSLDYELSRAAWRQTFKFADNCGFNNGNFTEGNTCLEEYAIQTLADGWKTAYFRLTAREWSPAYNATIQGWRTTMSEDVACIYNPAKSLATGRGFCNGTLLDLENNVAEMVTLNHEFQTPAYGVGQMTHVASAFVGLEAAQKRVTFTSSDVYARMARQYFREGDLKAKSTGAFAVGGQNDPVGCRQEVGGVLSEPVHVCYDAQKTANPANWYRADHFPVRRFYDRSNIFGTNYTYNAVNWNFTTYNQPAFEQSAFYWPARFEAYVTMGHIWVEPTTRPALRGNGRYKAGLLRTTNWFLVSNGQNTTPTATGNATDATGRFLEETFTIEDLTPNTPLSNGDWVTIKNQHGYYLEATNGGGSTVVTRYNYVTNNAKFKIQKYGNAPTEMVAHNDIFSLKTWNNVNFLIAPPGGTLSATATTGSAFNDTAFVLHRLMTD